MNKFTFFSIVATMWIMALFPIKVNAATYYGYVDINGVTYRWSKNATAKYGIVSFASRDIVGDVTIVRAITNDGETYPITVMSGQAFNDCTKLTSIYLPETIDDIQGSTFKGCSSLTSIEIPPKIKEVSGICWDCTSLGKITLPASITLIGQRSFVNIKPNAIITCHAVTPPQCVSGKNIAPPFDEEDLDKKTLFVPAQSVAAYRATEPWSKMNVYAIGTMTNEVITDDNIVYTLDNTFMTASVRSNQSTSLSGAITIASTVRANNATYRVTSIAPNAFTKCNKITSVVVLKGTTSIGEKAFLGCSALTSVELPEGITKLDNSTFMWCWALAGITLPSSLGSIDYGCFFDIKSDAIITCHNPNPPTCLSGVIDLDGSVNVGVFKDVDNYQKTLYVPAQSVAAYKATAPWSEMKVSAMAGTSPGDVDGDGVVDMNDVNVAINAMLGRTNIGHPDVNGDSTVDMADINIIINKMLGK